MRRAQDEPETPGEIDDLIRRALSDEIPAEVEARLERRVDLFLESRRRPGRSRTVLALLDFLNVTGAGGLRWSRVALAVASALLVVCGIVLHLAGSRSAFADSLTQVNVQVSLVHAIRLAPPIACEVTIGEDEGVQANGVIEWTGAGEARADLRRTGERFTLSVDPAGAVFGDWNRKTERRLEGSDPIAGTPFGAVADILTSHGLAERLYRDWILLRYGPGPERGTVAFVFRSPRDDALVELVAEEGTLLPRTIRKIAGEGVDGGGEGEQGFSAVFISRSGPARGTESRPERDP